MSRNVKSVFDRHSLCRWFAVLLCAVVSSSLTVMAQEERLPAFPGAEGFGRYVTGGRGGSVVHVTTLDDGEQSGTLRWALKQNGAKTIVFDLSGTIHLKSALAITTPNVTLAGQTAPGDGICIADYPFTIKANNVIVRFMRFRLGNLHVDEHEGDGLGGMDRKNIMVDHCSVSWSIDECCSVYGMENMTVQWCIVSQSLQDAGHSKGTHGFGGNWGGSGASYHHNLICHHNSRTPRLGPRTTTQLDERMDMRNNVIYNWAGNGCYGGEAMTVNMVNNYYKPGPATKQRPTSVQYRIAKLGIRTVDYITNTNSGFAPTLHRWGKYYVDGNFMEGFPEVTKDNWTKGVYEQIEADKCDGLYNATVRDTIRLTEPMDFACVTTHTAEKAYEKVLQYAGASLRRDWLDDLMVSDTRNGVASYTGTGNPPGIINSQDDNKPANADANWCAWPELKSDAALADTDRDGMPDEWETANGLNPNDPADRNNTNAEGYTMLEVYMNSLVADIMNGGMEGGEPLGFTIAEANGDQEECADITLSEGTVTSAAGSSSPWLFENGCTITNTKGKTLGTRDGFIKFSNGTDYTVTLPDNIRVTSVIVKGYDNYADADSYLSKLGSMTFSASDYIFPARDAANNAKTVEHTINMTTPVSGSFVFAFGGKQVLASLTLKSSTASAIHSVTEQTASCVNVYTLQGVQLRSNVSHGEALRGLPSGLYIINGKKIMSK